MYHHFDDLGTLGLASGHDRELAVSSLTPPPNVSPISTSSSIGSPHAWRRSRYRTTCAPTLNRIRTTLSALADLGTRSRPVSVAKSARPPLAVDSSQFILLAFGRDLACSSLRVSRAHCGYRLVSVLMRSVRRWGRSKRMKMRKTRISTSSGMMFPPSTRRHKRRCYSTYLPACQLPVLLPETQTWKARRALQILNSQRTSRATRSIHLYTSRAIRRSNCQIEIPGSPVHHFHRPHIFSAFVAVHEEQRRVQC